MVLEVCDEGGGKDGDRRKIIYCYRVNLPASLSVWLSTSNGVLRYRGSHVDRVVFPCYVLLSFARRFLRRFSLRLECERDRASVEAGTLRREIAALKSDHERTAQVDVFLFSFLSKEFVESFVS